MSGMGENASPLAPLADLSLLADLTIYKRIPLDRSAPRFQHVGNLIEFMVKGKLQMLL